jgi:hypothetical protein
LLASTETIAGLDELFERQTMGNMTIYVAR